MKSTFASTWNRVFALLGRVSMYRLVFLSLALLAVISFLLAASGLLSVGWLDILVTAAVLAVVNVGVDATAQSILRLPWRIESSLITSLILLFVLHPTVQPLGLVGAAIAAAVASLSKYVLAWRGRHIFNPAAVGAAVLTLIAALTGAFALGTSWWWVGTPVLGPIVLLLGIVVLWRIEKLRVIAVFWVVALVVSVVNLSVQSSLNGQAPDVWSVLWAQLWSSPIVFLGAFMLSEPLTMPPRRWQQLSVAAVVGVLVGWAPAIGAFPVSLGQERALLIGNLIAFLFAVRTAVRLVLVSRAEPTPTVRELTFRTKRALAFAAGQYIELEVPHRKPDARGTRREFSIVSAPEDLPTLRIAFREGGGAVSSFKKALAEVDAGASLPVTGVWGDFVLPRDRAAKILLVAAGIGVTPFVSQLRHLAATGDQRDIVLVYVASEAAELAFREDLESSGIRVVAFTRDEPIDLPPNWDWAGGTRIDAEGLHREVPDLAQRHAYVSGPAGLIADLAPALEKTRSITTDAFSGY